MNIDECKSYATEQRLTAYLKKYGLEKFRPVVVRNRDGRWTAVFGAGFCNGCILMVAASGFMVLG